jgi:ATP-dependent Clp protease ATP-binding subunit ClpA
VFDRFTEGARQTIVLAQEEARRLRHNYIGTEHLLLGLLREHDDLAAQVLAEMGVVLDEVRGQVVRLVGTGEEVTSGQIPFTPRLKAVLEKSLAEALSLDADTIGTEYLLLGLARQSGGVAARILLDLGVDPEELRWRVLRTRRPGVLAKHGTVVRQRLRAIEGRLSVFERREKVARIVGEARDAEDAARALCRELDLFPDQAEALLNTRVSAWTSTEKARLEQERDMLRAELGGD